ncbi:MAG TPA: calcium/proton exchanger [bacterium]|nr:calcium/proton exchanger [bacterium]
MSAKSFLRDPGNWLVGLIVFFPVAVVLQLKEAPPLYAFAAAALAIVPLAELIGRSTEALAHHAGPGVGGLLNATLGNAAELIIALMLLRSGQLDVVKASLTGSIIGNLLLVLGFAFFAAGLKFEAPTFNATAAESSAATLILAVIAMLVPAVFHGAEREASLSVLSELSIGIALILIAVYVAGLVFSLKTHKHLFQGDEADAQAKDEKPPMGLPAALAVLAAATGAVVWMSEILARTVESASLALHLSHTFVGMVIVAIVGNAAEHSTAVMMARKGKMDLAIGIAVESSKQIALFVAPALVLLSLVLAPEPMTLEFTTMEVVSVVAATGIVTVVVLDGKTNWLEGVQLVAVYAVLAVVFFFMP